MDDDTSGRPTDDQRSGPLAGFRVIEMEGRGPGPFAGMLLSDMGASVLRVSPPVPRHRTMPVEPVFDVLGRGRAWVRVDLKDPAGIDVVLRLVDEADGLIEGFRPGVMERLGLGPEVCLARNRRLVYGRMTGWGQEGGRAGAAGHDLTYLAMAGVVGLLGPADRPPPPPLNLIGDYGAGGAMLAFGMVCGFLQAGRSGEGQVIDASIVDGALLQLASILGKLKAGSWSDQRQSNFTDGGAPFYDVYETADGGFVAVAALEPEFYRQLIDGLGLTDTGLPERMDRDSWPRLREVFAERFRTRTRDEWDELFSGTDACVAPVLGIGELEGHPFHRERGSFVDVGGSRQPAPVPRMSVTPATAGSMPVGVDPAAELCRWGLSDEMVASLVDSGAVQGGWAAGDR